MADEKPNDTKSRARVEDANYVLSIDEPNLPRVREEPSGSVVPVAGMLILCAALLALMAALTSNVRMPEKPPAEVVFAAVTSAPRRAARPAAELEDVSGPVAAYYRAKGRDLVPGVGVYAVDPDGICASLRPGDVITAVNGEARSADEVTRVLEDETEALTFTVYREGSYLEVRIFP